MKTYMKTRMNKLNKLINKTHYSNSTIKNKRFYFLLSIILIITIVGIVIKISFFNLFIYYFFLLYLFFILNKSARSNKYLDNILSESNIIIRLLIPIINLPFGFNLIVICLIKFIITILSRIYLLDKLTYKSSIFTLIFCLGSNFVSPIITIYLLEFYMITINNYNNMGNYSVINSMFPNERRLSNWQLRAQEEQDFKEHQKNLQEMLKNTEHGINYNELVPAEINDFNIAKANNAFDALHKNAQAPYGRIEIAKRGSDLLKKIRDEDYINDGSPIHSKFTYNELAVLKYFGKHFHLDHVSGYNGIIKHGSFTNTEPYNIEITRSISSNSDFGKHLENDVFFYKKNIRAKLTALNNKTWNID
mgnify:CR=1 FL=1